MALDAHVVLSGVSLAADDCILCVDTAQQVVFASAATQAVLGWAPADLVGRPVATVLPDIADGPDGSPACSPVARALGGEAVPTYVTRRRLRDGALGSAAVSLDTLRNGGEAVGVTAVVRADTVERRAVEPAPRAGLDTDPADATVYRAIVETAGEGIAVTGPDGAVVLANARFTELLGRDTAELEHMDLHALLGLPPVPGQEQVGAEEPVQRQSSYRHPDGATRLLSASRSSLRASGDTGWLLRVSDVTEARRAEDELRRLALHDPLTGLPNRQLVHDRLQMASARVRRHATGTVGVLFLDLDGFKTVNDTLGHAAGDAVLVEVGRRLGETVRASDTVGRLGGDEFAIICEQVGEAALAEVAARLHRAIQEPIEHAGGRLVVRASIGVALAPPHEVGDLLRRADAAMYDAKVLGSGGTSLADPAGGSRPLTEASGDWPA